MDTSTSGVTKQEWDSVRERFKSSMMVGTEMGKLASNVDRVWPLKGREEVPLRYLPLTLEEVVQLPGIAESPKRVRLMVDIFEETMAFDEPFGEMAEQVDSSSKHDDKPLKMLKEMGIPHEYPISLCNVSEETRKFCADEDLKTIGQFLLFAQSMAQNVVVGGDFRNLLNSFTGEDQHAIAKFLPFRPGHTGLHLAEAIGHIARSLRPDEYALLADRFGAKLTDAQKSLKPLGQPEVAALEGKLREVAPQVLGFFPNDAETLRQALKAGGSQLDRFFHSLNDPQHEAVTSGVAAIMLGESTAAKGRKKGFLARLFGR